MLGDELARCIVDVLMQAPAIFLTFCLTLATAFAETPAPPVAQIAVPDTLIAAEAFDRAESFASKGQKGAEGWRGGIGEWSIVDGAAYAKMEGPSEKRPKGHEAVCEHITDLGDLLFTGEFKLGTAPQIGFVCRDTNNPNNHLGRVVITPKAIWIQKMSGIAKETRKEELQRIEVTVDPDAWHRITIEVVGDHWFARIDDHIIEAHHERFLARKGRVGMVAGGEGAQFRNIALWSAQPKS